MKKLLTTQIAHAFADVLKEWLTSDELQQVIELNDTPAYQDGCCATHNFCDANMAMDEAFVRVLHRHVNIHRDKDTTLWNNAWDMAKAHHFFINK